MASESQGNPLVHLDDCDADLCVCVCVCNYNPIKAAYLFKSFYLSDLLKMCLVNKAVSSPICNWMITLCSLCLHWMSTFNHPNYWCNRDNYEILIRIFPSFLNIGPVGWRRRIYWLHLCKLVRPLNECPVTQSAGAVEYTNYISVNG